MDCRSRNFRFDAARQAAPFGPVLRKVVHRFKYSGGRSLAAPLCDLVLEAACGLPGTAQAVTWIPPSPERLRRTGVDHGRILAELVAGSLGKPAVALAARTRRTRPQMRLSPDERRTNVAGAFRATGCTPDSVLLVDDVFTTGSTASEMARALKASGASRVVVATAARSFAVGGPDL
ncbi:MAG TPA: ComF family protein [Actinomycetota bacterium]|nr:ComF family protein [Actinomycetota bacterium]